jgi:hypothetical protein
MKKLVLICGLSLLLGAPLVAQSAPELEFSAGGDTAWVSLTPNGSGSWTVSPETQVTLNNGISFTLNTVTVNSDPNVFYSFNVTNNTGSPMTYTASIPAVPASLAPGAYTVSSSLGITLTNASEGNTVSISPAASATSIQQGLIGANDAGVDIGTTFANSVFGTTSTTSFSGGPSVYNLGAPASDISVTESFELSAGASVGVSGFFDVQAVPEPSSVALGGIALGAFALLIFRARRMRA